MSSTHTKIWAVIPAAGIGTRMQAERPKQYLPLFRQTLIEITLRKILSLPDLAGVVLVLNSNDVYWDKTSLANHPNIHRVTGGKQRSDSVLCGLQYCTKISNKGLNDDWALVHDAARPCVAIEKIQELISLGLEKAEQEASDGVILASPIADTVKRVNHSQEIRKTEDRSELWLAHTPQFFPIQKLRSSIESCNSRGVQITDEASAIEACGGNVSVVQDRRDNIKVTVPEDLAWAENILRQQGFE